MDKSILMELSIPTQDTIPQDIPHPGGHVNEFSRAGLFLHSLGDLHFISCKLPPDTELG